MGQANSRQPFFGLNLRTFNVVLLTIGLLVVLSLRTLGILGTIRLAVGTFVVAVLVCLARLAWRVIASGGRRLRWAVAAAAVVLIVATVVRLWPHAERRWAVYDIERVRGNVFYAGDPNMPDWLQQLLGERIVNQWGKLAGDVKTVYLNHLGDRLTNRHFARLSKLPEIYWLDLSGTKVSDSELVHLKNLTNLGFLSFSDGHTEHGTNNITDDGLEHLRGLTKLRSLSLGDTKITDKGLAKLSSMTGLRFLFLDRTQIADDGLSHLSGLTGLTQLGLSGTNVTDEGVQKIRSPLPGKWKQTPHGYMRSMDP